MHYYQFNIGDYRSSTAHLSNDEDLAYRRLLDMYYDSEKKIPLDTQWVAKRLRLEASVIRDVLNDMFVKHDDGWFHSKCDEIIQNYQAMAEKNRANGRLGGRKKNPVGSQVDADWQPSAKATNNYKQETRNDKPKTKDKEAASAFELPDWMPVETWDAFIEMRTKMRKRPTDTAVKLLCNKLSKFHSQGQDIKAILEKSITNNWQDVFELKDFSQQRPAQISFAQQERELGWKRWEEMTGREHPDRLAHEGKRPNQFIEIQATDILEIGK